MDSVGGEDIQLAHISSSFTVLPDFALDNISLIQLLHLLLRPFCCESYAITPPRKLLTPVSVPTSAILPNQTATDYNEHYHNRSASQRQSSHLQIPHTSVDNQRDDDNSNDNDEEQWIILYYLLSSSSTVAMRCQSRPLQSPYDSPVSKSTGRF